MIAYTNIRGRGQIHGYDFIAATLRLPYGAAWTNQLRDHETIDNKPVLELQANVYGEMLLIRSQTVLGEGRPYSVTQYVHPVPAEEELAGKPLAAYMAEHVDALLFYDSFYPPEAFPALDNNPRSARVVLEPQPIALPTIPAQEPVTCEDRLLAPLLAELWKNCDLRIRHEKNLSPIRICVCDSAHAADTLEAGCLLMAKTVIPRLPPAVRNILSVTIGAKWDMVNAYENTACCIAQFEGDHIGVGYDLVNRVAIPHLQHSEAMLGAAILHDEHMAYYHHMEAMVPASPLCADFQIALLLFVMRQFLANPARFREQPSLCFDLWKNLEDDIRNRFDEGRDVRLLRALLYPVERDIVTRLAELGTGGALNRAEHAMLTGKAFTLQEMLPEHAGELLSAYARCLALPKQAENPSEACFVWLVQLAKADLRAPLNAALFVAALLEYLMAFAFTVTLDDLLIDRLERQFATLGSENLTVLKPKLIECITQCSLSGQPQRIANRMSAMFALGPEDMDAQVINRFQATLACCTVFDPSLKEFFDSRSASTNAGVRQKMLTLLDQRFDAMRLTPEAWLSYLALCRLITYGGETPLSKAWEGLERIHPAQSMTDAEADALLDFCRASGGEAFAREAAFKHYDRRADLFDDSAAMRAQTRRWANLYPALLAPERVPSPVWDAVRSAVLAEALHAALAQATGWPALRTLRQAWLRALKPPLAADAVWQRLPELLDTDTVDQALAEACARVLAAEAPTLAAAEEQLAFVARAADWYAKALQKPVLAHLAGSMEALWKAATGRADVERLLALSRKAAELDGRGAPEGRDTLPAQGVPLAAALYLDAVALFASGGPCGLRTPEARLSEAAAVAGKIADCDRAEEVSALLRRGFGTARRAVAQDVMEACLCSLRRYPEGVRIEWDRVFALLLLDGAPPRGKPLDGADPWQAQGMRLLRSLLTCLLVSDRLGLAVNPYPLQRYLCESCPRLTGAARRKRKLRRRLRACFGPDGKPARDAARDALGNGGVAWLLD